MITKTENYQFQKPDEDEFYDISVQNQNWDQVDAALKNPDGNISETLIKDLETPTEDFPVPEAGEKAKSFFGKVKKFMEDFNYFKTGIITVGKLANNSLTTESGFALDARMGKTLADQITELNSNLQWTISDLTTYLNTKDTFVDLINKSPNGIAMCTLWTASTNYPNYCFPSSAPRVSLVIIKTGWVYYMAFLIDTDGNNIYMFGRSTGAVWKCALTDYELPNASSGDYKISDKLTLASYITKTEPMFYKIGNLVSINIVLQNTSGATIGKWNNLMVLPTGFCPRDAFKFLEPTTQKCLMLFGDGKLQNVEPIEADKYLQITLTYPVI